jgi:hypothetical protein
MDSLPPPLRSMQSEAAMHTQWAEAVLIVAFDESHGQVVQHVHPPDAVSACVLCAICVCMCVAVGCRLYVICVCVSV